MIKFTVNIFSCTAGVKILRSCLSDIVINIYLSGIHILKKGHIKDGEFFIKNEGGGGGEGGYMALD